MNIRRAVLLAPVALFVVIVGANFAKYVAMSPAERVAYDRAKAQEEERYRTAYRAEKEQAARARHAKEERIEMDRVFREARAVVWLTYGDGKPEWKFSEDPATGTVKPLGNGFYEVKGKALFDDDFATPVEHRWSAKVEAGRNGALRVTSTRMD